jgi:hypothetical protein
MNSSDTTNKGLDNLKKMYDKLSYFDQYGFSFILFIIITIIVVIVVNACIALTKVKSIKEDWANQRCNPLIMPIAGFINKPDNVSFNDFTAENFTYCTQNMLKAISGNSLQPLNYIVSSGSSFLDNAKNSVNGMRGMFAKIRTFFSTFVNEIMNRLLNSLIPIQEIIIKFKDFVVKVQGTMISGIYTSLGVYFALKSILGIVVKIIVTILIAAIAIIFAFWLFPFTWGSAIAGTALFVAISIPLALVLTFMTRVMGISTGLSIPKLKSPPKIKCFDKNTQIKLNDGTIKSISELNIGDKIINNNLITAKIVVETKGSIMYQLNGIIVSDSHIVKYGNEWLRVDEHPNAIKLEDYNEPYLYCLNTENKVIEINNIIFTDWDEIYDDELEKIKDVKIKNILCNLNRSINYDIDKINVNNLDIHKYLNGGFDKNTEIKLKNGNIKPIKNISIGDILENGERVYGYVEIETSNLSEKAIYNLAKNKSFVGCNLNICDKSLGFTSTLELDKKYKNLKFSDNCDLKLYHLLTDSKTFNVNGIKFYDYNSCIDLFLEKYRGKLLSMKYV